MQVAMLQTMNPAAPTHGAALYLVADENGGKTRILHVPSLSTFELTHSDFRNAFLYELWPAPHDGRVKYSGVKPIEIALADQLEAKVQLANRYGKAYSEPLIRRCLAALRGKDVADVPMLKPREETPTPKPARTRVVSANPDKAKRPGVVQFICDLFEEGVTIDEAVSKLSAAFPERNPEGMRTTVRCQSKRLPEARARVLTSTFDATRKGNVFRWADSTKGAAVAGSAAVVAAPVKRGKKADLEAAADRAVARFNDAHEGTGVKAVVEKAKKRGKNAA